MKRKNASSSGGRPKKSIMRDPPRPPMAERLDPKKRGIHADAIRAEVASSSRAACVDCGRMIAKDSPRWGIKYGGNPLSEPVIPLYGTHPMYMWCHSGGCGLSYIRIDDSMPIATRVCHICSDVPGEIGELRLLCGGSPKGAKFRQHPFHVRCWKKAILESKLDNGVLEAILIKPSDIGRRSKLTWDDLSYSEKMLVREAFES